MFIQFFAPPKFTDEELTRSASQLRTVVLTMLGMSTLYILAWIALVPNFSYRIIFALPLYPLFGWLLYLIRKGNVKLAGSMLVAGVWLTLFFAASFSGGVLAPGYSGLLITVLAAGIFMSRGWANVIALVSVIGGGILVALERWEMMPAASEFTEPTTMWIAQAVFFFIAASLLQMGTQRISDALQTARREIEGRRKTEEQLRDAEKQYRELIERVPVVIYSAEPGPAGRWFYVSPRIEALSGYKPEEWMADPNLWYSLLETKDRDAFIQGETLALAEGRRFQMEYQLRRKDGTTIWIRDESLNVTGGESGDKKIVQGYLLDITESKLAEEKLRANEVLLTTTIENIPFDFWVCDENDRYILQNPVSRNLAGDLIGKTVDDLDLPLFMRDSYREKHKQILKGETLRSEEEYEKDGKRFHVLLIGAPIRDAEKLRGFIGMTIDITDQKRTQEALRDAELLYRTLVEQTSVVIYRDAAKEGGPSIFISPQIKDMIGYTAEEFTSNPIFWHTLIHPDDKEHALETVRQVVTNGENKISEYRLRAKNGEWVWIRDEAVVVKNEQGKSLYVQGVYMDITKQKQMEEQRESLIEELEAKNTELERFTYTVSHDLKAPLITMGGFLGFLEQDALSGNIERLKSDIQRISEANSKMQQLLNELLELSRIGRLINPPENIPFEQIVRDALSRVETQLGKKKVEVRIGGGLPVVRGDRVRLVEVVQNLLENAAKFTENQTDPKIEIGSNTDAGGQHFFVRDNGIGIDPKYHAKIFELFNKLNPKAEGTGIGLALVKRIIEVHGGKIWVDSDSGKGATFYFTLPSSE